MKPLCSSSSDNTSEDGGDVTPTELRPEVLIEVENKEEIVEEVEKREKSPADQGNLLKGIVIWFLRREEIEPIKSLFSSSLNKMVQNILKKNLKKKI